MSERTVSTAQRGRMLASTIGKPVLFAVLMWLASAAGEISIPGTPVPITLQTFVMMLAGLMLSWRQAGSAVVLYLAAGAAGLPVFAGGASTAALFGPSAGFLIGFLPAVIVTALLRGKARLDSAPRRADRRSATSAPHWPATWWCCTCSASRFSPWSCMFRSRPWRLRRWAS